jgi:hypothetical protein
MFRAEKVSQMCRKVNPLLTMACYRKDLSLEARRVKLIRKVESAVTEVPEWNRKCVGAPRE